MSELNVMDFGIGVGTGSASVDTAAWQAALNALDADTKKLVAPPAEYLINQELRAPLGLNCAEIVSQGGYDGIRGAVNNGLHTSLKWVGPADATKAVIRFDQASGVVWRGISINCNHNTGYGLQLMSSSPTTGSVKNIVERCSVHYALRDGIIVGEWGEPTANPGDRQFFANRFSDLTFYGCAYSAIHVNEWNADQQIFDSISLYYDDSPTAQPIRHGIWFDSGGQASMLDTCQGGFGALPEALEGVEGAGYLIFNKKMGSSIGGAFGLDVRNCWMEGACGLYWGVTSTSDHKANKFSRCAAFTGDPDNHPSVYIDKGTSTQIPHTFDTCTFLSNIKIDSSTFLKQSLHIQNCAFASGKGVVDSDGVLTDGACAAAPVSGGVLVLPRYADVVQVTLNQNVSVVYGLGVSKRSDRLTIIAKQDNVGGWTINFAASGNFSSNPPIPDPKPGANTVTTYSFIGDGTKYYLTSAAS